MEELISPKRDIIFKKLFGEEGNERILKNFLEAILEIEIDNLKLDLSTEIFPEHFKGKECFVDVRTKLKDGTEVNIEMQMNKYDYSDKRCLNYWARLYSNQIKAGDEYEKLRKTICIWILNDEIMPEFQEYQSKWKMTNEKNGVKNRFEDIEFHIIELKKFRNDVRIKSSRKNFWLWFIDHTNREMVEMACEQSEEIAEAKREYERITAIPGLVEQIEAEERVRRDKHLRESNIRQEGKEEGKEETKTEIAKNMIESGYNLQEIAKITGLSEDEISKIQEG